MKNSLRSIHEAGLGRRMVAMIMDAAVFAFTMVALALWVFTPIVKATMNYDGLGVQGLKWEVFSKLYVSEVKDDAGNKQVVDITKVDVLNGELIYTPLYNYTSADTSFYKERLHYYYCCYKTGENVEVPEGKDINDFRSPDYNVPIKDKDGNEVLPKDYFTESWFASLIDGKSSVDDYKNLSYEAVKDLREKPFFVELNKKIQNCQLVMILPAFGASFLTFYLLVPLLYKNGETFGKKVMHLGLISKDGYAIKKRQIVFRQILLLAWVSFFSFIVGIGLTSIAVLGVGVVIYLIATAISKTKRSPIDYAAYTYMIDTSKSVWFKDPEEEGKKEEELAEKMSKYRRYEPDKSHLIQVGTEIVNEQVKKEFEEEKSKKAKK